MTDGSGLTARQTANRLWSAGHVVEALAPDPLCLCRFTRHVGGIRRVSAYGPDPLHWLDTALDTYRSGRFDVLFPTQEQVAVLARFRKALPIAVCGRRCLGSLPCRRCRTSSPRSRR